MKENYTQPLADVKAEIRELKANLSRDFVGSCLFSKVKKELCDLKEEMHTVKQNLSGVSGGKVIVLFINPFLYKPTISITSCTSKKRRSET